jgi:DNA-binding CsgD family transcriptional regulator
MLHLLGQGLDTSEIAERLGITFATAQTHRRQITGRLGVKGSRLLQLARSLPQPDAPDV